MVADSSTSKVCKKCSVRKPLKDFGFDKRKKDGHHGSCRKCSLVFARTYLAKRLQERPEEYRAMKHYSEWKSSLKKHGIDVARYEKELQKHGGVCAICKKPPTSSRRLSVDHDHACCSDRRKSCGKCFRGLLCTTCNISLGGLYSQTLLFNAIAYLQKFEGESHQ